MSSVSALVLASLLGTGCIVAEAPDYGSPQRSPPFMSQPSPNPTSFQELPFGPGNAGVTFSVIVRSEDAGEQLVSAWFIDYKHITEDGNWQIFPPATFDQKRTISYTMGPAQITQGTCHSFTIMTMHLTNWDSANRRPKETSDDFASVTWFVAADPNGVVLVSQCPSTSTETP